MRERRMEGLMLYALVTVPGPNGSVRLRFYDPIKDQIARKVFVSADVPGCSVEGMRLVQTGAESTGHEETHLRIATQRPHGGWAWDMGNGIYAHTVQLDAEAPAWNAGDTVNLLPPTTE